MDLRRLGYFVRIAEDGSLTRSAANLRIAQPALSRQMRLLESELGVPLFTRTARGMRLTEEGERLRTVVAGPLRELELGLANLRPSGRRTAESFTIGLTPGMAEAVGEPLGIRAIRDFPQATARIVEGPTGSLIDWLVRGVVDLAILEEASRDSRLRDRPLIEDELWLVGTDIGALCPHGGHAVAFDTIRTLPLILSSHHLGVRTTLDAAAARAGASLNIVAYADSPRLARQYSAAEIGYAVLPSRYAAAAAGLGEIAARPIASPRLPLAITLTSRKGASRSALLAEVERVIGEVVRDEEPDG